MDPADARPCRIGDGANTLRYEFSVDDGSGKIRQFILDFDLRSGVWSAAAYSPENDQWDAIDDRPTIEALRGCVNKTVMALSSARTERQKQAVHLFRLYRRQVDVAKMMGISKQAVHRLLRKAGEI